MAAAVAAAQPVARAGHQPLPRPARPLRRARQDRRHHRRLADRARRGEGPSERRRPAGRVARRGRRGETVASTASTTPRSARATSTAAMDSKDCVMCGHEYVYAARYFGHLGVWHCPACGRLAPAPPQLHAPSGSLGARQLLHLRRRALHRHPTRAARPVQRVQRPRRGGDRRAGRRPRDAILSALGASRRHSAGWSASTSEARPPTLLLVKNPTGANQSLAAVFSDREPQDARVRAQRQLRRRHGYLVDLGRRVRGVRPAIARFVASGIRADDAAVRLKYAGLPLDRLEVVDRPR